ncbi:hypothetical protein SSA02_00850 [Swaminathania salitolerans]|uniref:Competence protein ComEC n=2 Tax=Swaminathania salitolerans TaxID=182838 RepID=A0A511BLF1_9PROT|nr:hypothetical protein SSA02_00850 [Swaminathania salitolerans]
MGGIEAILFRQGRALFGWMPVLWAAGVLLYFQLRYEPGWQSACPIAVLGGTVLCAGWRRIGSRVAGFVLLLPALGFLDASWQAHRQTPMPALPSLSVVLSGTIRDVRDLGRESPDLFRQRLVVADAVFETGVDAGMSPLQRRLLLSLRSERPLSPGDRIRARALLHPPSPPFYPGGRDPQRRAWFDGTAGTGRILNEPVLIAQTTRRNPDLWRAAIARHIGETLPGQDGAIAATLLAGHDEGISRETRASFAASGLAHILAVAGLHLGLVMGAVFVALRQCLVFWPRIGLRLPCREIAALVALAVGAGYVLLTGAHLPALRSLGMAGLATCALLASRRVLSMRSLAIVALLLLIVSPVLVLDLSFQMSFAAVMALIAGYDVLRPVLRRDAERFRGRTSRRILHHVGLLALTSALAGGATLPLVMAGFGTVQPWFILANLVAVPLAGICVMPFGLLSLLAMSFGLASVPLTIMGLGIRAIRFLADHVAQSPFATVSVPLMPGWGIALYMAGLAGLCLWRGKARGLFLLPVSGAVLSFLFVAPPLVLVSPDAGLIAFRDGGVLHAGPHGALETPVLEAWQRAFALPVRPAAAHRGCTGEGCKLVLDGYPLILHFADGRSGADRSPCPPSASRAIVISRSPLPEPCPSRLSVDRFTVWRNGAVALYLHDGDPHERDPHGNGPVMVSDRSWRGTRLWVPPPGYRGKPNLPLARTE